MKNHMTSIDEIRNQVMAQRLSRLDATIAAIAIGGLSTLQVKYRDPREKDVKQIGPRPDGAATEEQRNITTGPKLGKGTRKQRKGKR